MFWAGVAKTVGTYKVRRERRAISDASFAAAGDVVLYQKDGSGIRRLLQKEILATPGDVVVFAHSLGGIAAVDLLAMEDLSAKVKGLVTIGTQAGFLYEIGALRSLRCDEEHQDALPAHFPKWLNFWDPNDFLSYSAEAVFGKAAVSDVMVREQAAVPGFARRLLGSSRRLGPDWRLFPVGLIDKTYAIVVAVEEYPGLGAKSTLPGVAEEAAKFVRWLIDDRHLPPAHIQVFTNGRADFGAVVQGNATADVVNKFLANVGVNWPDGELLLIYWAGHGFVSREGTRRLFFGDATSAVKSNLDMEQLIQVLRSTARGGFNQQIAIIDACARFFESLQSTKGLPAGGLPQGNVQLKGVKQYFYFAASSGEYATQSVFGKKVLELLKVVPAEEWPPNARVLRNGIEELFDQLVADRPARQQPAWLEYSDDEDNRLQRGVLPTTDEIHEAVKRAVLPLPFIRSLAEQAVRCPTLSPQEGRDLLVAALPATLPIFRPRATRDDQAIDLMYLILGSIEQGLEEPLALEIVRMEENSTPAYLFRKMIASVSRLREVLASAGQYTAYHGAGPDLVLSGSPALERSSRAGISRAGGGDTSSS